MYVLNIETGKKHLAKVVQIGSEEIKRVNRTKQFDFNWNKESAFKVYKLIIDDIEEPIGLMSLNERPDDYALEIRLLASSKANVGKDQQYGRIAGCLIAFACREAFKGGYDGFVCLKPKTKLEPHYIKKYGFESTKLFLVTEGRNSLKLIKEYYENQ
ncbi:hypothetical protein DU508_13645 [Pedobacter chinensis]|uniref:N-acetyltransferase n=1 Tax=Pedobacter chinensis TaxID=2282421 RepID=A0A369Q0P8_9SPHI|nr:hypothetical protein [Pedobacter chinensis]RDC55908.1 hypothetical protein DU508_13645 [Pedobacter chinensis]